MKKLLLAVILVCLLASMCGGCVTKHEAAKETKSGTSVTKETSSESLYKVKTGEIIENLGEYGRGEGFLCDLDGDGQEELMLYHTIDGADSSRDMFLSMYTIKDDKLVEIAAAEHKSVDVGASGSSPCIAHKDGETYLVGSAFSKSGDVSKDASAGENVEMFKLENNKLVTATYGSVLKVGNNGITPYEIKSEVAKIEDKTVTIDEYEQWLKSFDYEYCKVQSFPDWDFPSLEVEEKDINKFYATLK